MEFVEIVALVLCCAVFLLFVIDFRRRLLLRGGGAVHMSLLARGRIGRRWSMGVGRYGGDQLQWYRVLTLSPRPAHVLPRGEIEVSGQHATAGTESWAVQAGSVIIECRYRDGEADADAPVDQVQIAMHSEAVTGFLSWIESSPPGYALPGHAAR